MLIIANDQGGGMALLLLLLLGLALLSNTNFITFYNLLVLLALLALTDSNSLGDIIGIGNNSFGGILMLKKDGKMCKDICFEKKGNTQKLSQLQCSK